MTLVSVTVYPVQINDWIRTRLRQRQRQQIKDVKKKRIRVQRRTKCGESRDKEVLVGLWEFEVGGGTRERGGI